MRTRPDHDSLLQILLDGIVRVRKGKRPVYVQKNGLVTERLSVARR